MRALSYLLSDFIGLVLVIFGGQAEVWAQTASLNWRIFEVSEYGTRVDYPARIFAPAGEPEKGIGQRFESADGSAVLSVYSSENEAADTPVSYLQEESATIRPRLRAGHSIFLCHFDGTRWKDLL